MKTIMLCLNQLGIGGVETAVLNQTIQLKKMGYQVVILAKKGIYKEHFEKEGAIIIDFEFIVQNNIDSEKVNVVVDIIKKYGINQVHIHQFDCINVVFPACVYTNTPYIAYTHTGIRGIYDWFENSFECYKILFEIYFKNARKIVSITEDAKKENQEKYKIDDEKYIIIKNSINFEKFNSTNNDMPKKIEKFLLLSRMGKEKLISLKNAIDIFKEYAKKHSNIKLTIAGDGESREEIEKYIEDIKENVVLLGQINNVSEIISQNDIVIGVDRCILETIAMKKIPLISGYENIKGLVTPQNISDASDFNFSAKNLNNLNVSEAVMQIEELNEIRIKDIINGNYEYAYKNLNINNNFFILETDEINDENYILKYFMDSMIILQNLCDKKGKEIESNWKEWSKAKEWYEIQIKNREDEIEAKREKILQQENEIIELKSKLKEEQLNADEREKQLERVYNSKSWKIAKKISGIFKGK